VSAVGAAARRDPLRAGFDAVEAATERRCYGKDRSAARNREVGMIEESIRQVVRDAVQEALAEFDWPSPADFQDNVVDPTPPRAMSVQQTAERLGLSRSSVYTLIGDGRLRTLRIGNRRLVLSSTIQEFLIDGEAEQAASAYNYCGSPSTAVYRRSPPRPTTVLLCDSQVCHERLIVGVLGG
jgi:excisionase family DNA binding protein